MTKRKFLRQWLVPFILFLMLTFWSVYTDQTPGETGPMELIPSPTMEVVSLSSPVLVSDGAVLAAGREVVTISRVVDGDTIKTTDGQTIRYIGIDTPETKDPNRPVGCYGQEASQKNKELVEGQQVELEKDVSETDRYGRLLRYVYQDGVMINELLVKEGYARATSYPPDVKYQDLFRRAEAQAREQQLGLWSEVCSDSTQL